MSSRNHGFDLTEDGVEGGCLEGLGSELVILQEVLEVQA